VPKFTKRGDNLLPT